MSRTTQAWFNSLAVTCAARLRRYLLLLEVLAIEHAHIPSGSHPTVVEWYHWRTAVHSPLVCLSISFPARAGLRSPYSIGRCLLVRTLWSPGCTSTQLTSTHESVSCICLSTLCQPLAVLRPAGLIPPSPQRTISTARCAQRTLVVSSDTRYPGVCRFTLDKHRMLCSRPVA